MLYCNIHTEVQERGVLGLLERDGRFRWKSGDKPLELIPSKVGRSDFPYHLKVRDGHKLYLWHGTNAKAIPIAKFLEAARRPDKTVEGKILEVTINGKSFKPEPASKAVHSVKITGSFSQPEDPGPIATILENKEDWDAMAELLDPLGVRWRGTGSALRNGREYPSKIKLIFNRQPGVMTFLWLTDKTNIPTVSHARFVQHVKKYLDYVARRP